MYAADFDYYRAASLADAARLLSANPGARLLAGGHSLIPLLKLRLSTPAAIIDIGRVPELGGISESGGALRIGALTTHAELAASDAVRSSAPALSEAAGLVGDPAVRNRGTIGGNIAHADPASDLPTVLVALDAEVIAVGSAGERTIRAADFFLGMMTTALAPGEILSAVVVRRQGRGQGSAYAKFPHPASRYAVVGAAAVVSMKDGTCKEARVAVGGMVPSARRVSAVERALTGTKADPAAIASASAQVRAALGQDVSGDIYASAEYRAAVAPVYVERAILGAVARAGNA